MENPQQLSDFKTLKQNILAIIVENKTKIAYYKEQINRCYSDINECTKITYRMSEKTYYNYIYGRRILIELTKKLQKLIE